MSNTTADAFLKSEIEQIEKSTKRTWYFGCVIIVILIAYLSFILFMTRTFLEPQNAAYLVSSNIKENLPQFINQTESMLVQKAPRTANQASHLFMGAIPQLREMAEEQIRITHEEMIPHLSRELQDMTRAYIADNAETLRSFSAEEGGPQLAEHVTAELMESMGAHMQTEFAEEWHGRNLVYIKENTLYALQAMNKHLDGLLSKEPAQMERKEVLQRRLLAILTHKLTHVNNHP